MSEIAPYDTEGALRATADKLKELLVGAETAEGEDGEHDSTYKHIARLAVALTAVCAELRQHAKARVREVSQISLDQIVSYLKTLPRETKADICQNLSGADDEAPLL